MKVHTAVGPGLLESAYEAFVSFELKRSGLEVRSQVGFPVTYEGVRLELGYRVDLLVEDLVIVELKCVEAIVPVHKAQLLSYLRLNGKPLGLLINFHVEHLKDGIRRVVNGYNWK
jgi:GxxExxY protein